jgi:hypothetical protein
MTGAADGPGGPGGATADQLRDVFDTLTTAVHGAPDGYPKALAEWRRRARRRRLVLAILAAVVFALADIIGLWALSNASTDTHIIFNDRPGSTGPPNGGIGPVP